MKKKIIAILIAVGILFTACGKSEVESEEERDGVKDNDTVSVVAVEIEAEEDNSPEKFEIPSFETDREFYDWLYDFFTNYDEYDVPSEFWAGDTAPIYELPWFEISSKSYCDINEDGREDFIISGPLGLRCLEGTNIYLTKEGGYDFFSTRGTIVKSKNGYVEISSVDYSMTEEGQDYYFEEEIIKIGENNEIVSLIRCSSICDIDDTPKTEKYYKGDEEITKEEYDTLLATYEEYLE